MFSIYIAGAMPFSHKSENYKQIYNEATIFYACMSLMLFTDFVPNVEVQNAIGWFVIFGVLFNIFFNWLMILANRLLIAFKCIKLAWTKKQRMKVLAYKQWILKLHMVH